MGRIFLQAFRACLYILLLHSGLLILSGCSSGNYNKQPDFVFKSPANAVIAGIQAELEMDVRLKIETQHQTDQWAFLTGIPLSTTGNYIDYSQTKFASDVREGYFDDGFAALTQKNQKSGNWKLVTLSLGATDAPFVDWPEQYGVPKSLIYSDN